jgi:hypothetical protein
MTKKNLRNRQKTSKTLKILKISEKTQKKIVKNPQKTLKNHPKSDCEKLLFFHLNWNPNLQKKTDDFF